MNIKTIKTAAMALSALLCLTTTGAMAQTTYKVSVKEGTEDASNWQGKAGEGEYQALPLEGVAAGTAVSVKYSGWKLLVKSVKAKKKPAASLIVNPAVGQVIGDDGKNYDYASLPGGVTAVAKICYVSGSNGLALALADEGQMNWGTAISTCAAHTPAFTNGTWKLATQDEWTNMITAAGGYTALRDGFSSVGGSNLLSNYYWSSTVDDSDSARIYGFYYGDWGYDDKVKDYVSVRACLAFYVPAATVTTAPTAKTGVKAGQNVAIVNAGTATGGTMMYKVTTANTKPTSTQGFSATVPTAASLTAGTRYVWYYVKGDASHTDSEISATAIAVTVAAPALNLTSPVVGQVIGNDGKNYNYASLPGGVTAVAKICYVSGSNGLALALADEGQMNWGTAISTCAAHTPAFTGGTWKLATKDEWTNMITAAGSDTALRDGFTSVGGTNLQSYFYWSSTEYSSSNVWDYVFSTGIWSYSSKDKDYVYVRACLAF